MNARALRIAALFVCTAIATPSFADELSDGFRNPPQSARPRVWWHWMNGNITKDGIDKDLDWMARMGIGGVQNFDVNLQTPQIVPQRLVYMTDAWKDAFRHAVRTADAKGLEFAIAASPGWSETGGPWVKPEDAMKKLVWSETALRGGGRVKGALAMPPSITGPFQNMSFSDEMPGADRGAVKPSFYRDARVIAYPAALHALPQPRITQGDGAPVEAVALMDGDVQSSAQIARGDAAKPGAMILDYGKPVTVRTANLFIPNARPPFRQPVYRPMLEAQVGGRWQVVGQFSLSEASSTMAFAPVTAQRFRLTLTRNDAAGGPGLGDGAPGAVMFDFLGQQENPNLAIGEFQLGSEPRIDRFEQKAGYALASDYDGMSGTAPADGPVVDPAKVVDLTDRLRPDGTLDWTAPKGSDWRIVRLGYSLTGKTNHPAPPEATGLEVDKYDAAAVRRYLESYIGMYRDAAGAEWIGKKGIRALLTDSIEVGPSNWTPRMIEEFKARRGYDPVPFLPTLVGAVVGSVARSDAFLHDFRQTLADLIADAHYGTVAKVAHENGLAVYGEALESGRPVLGDDLAMRSHADVPMAALWTFNRGESPRPTLIGDMKGAASVAHIYGQNIVAAESMTSAFAPWAFAPSDLKRVIDLEFASGVNRPIVHTSVHQPVDDKVPGLSLMIFGQYFNRHESWADMAKPWVDYMARTAFLLQQGRNHADVAYFYGEDQPITAQFEGGSPADLPIRYAYDFVNAEILSKQLTVENGELVTPGGARYKALYLGGGSRAMTLPTLQRIAALVEAGATVIGLAPERASALQDDAGAFQALCQRLWSGQGVGKGRVIASRDVEAALEGVGVVPDLQIASGGADRDYRFVHRRLADGDIYFLNNRTEKAGSIEARFRITGKRPEIWRAIEGTAQPISYRIEGGETVVPIDVGPEDAFFIVFRDTASAPSANVAAKTPHAVTTLDRPWTVNFQPQRGAPARVDMPTLAPLETSMEMGVRYFSGIASYATRFRLPKGVKRGDRLWIDLGKVGDVAEVRVNGQVAGTGWFAPYRLDIGPLVKPGDNALEIRVANLWVNRLIGDQQPGARKVTFTTAPTYKPDAPLRPSGLIGPVTLMAE
ncbi:glycosyl hydrolase [Sphingobium sp. H39-3-25]|uniref:glycosyl hydrolase n=1 Tax=Sphingobium arseniciresistens TaxID=3030834 RepID=UPI0023B9105E|nr:glycosyl hydrolase [Sphingobium arseniciresistens]